MIDDGRLGTPRKDSDATLLACSKCNTTIPDEHVPLMLFADGRNLMWVYCENCEVEMFRVLYKQKED